MRRQTDPVYEGVILTACNEYKEIVGWVSWACLSRPDCNTRSGTGAEMNYELHSAWEIGSILPAENRGLSSRISEK